FIVATREDAAEYARLLSCLRENNQLWASQAPVLMVSVAKLAFDMNGQPNRYAFHDVGLAVANLIVQATALGLCVHQMAGFYPDKVREFYSVPDDFEPVAGIVLGYPGDPATLPEDLRQRELAPRPRKPFEAFVFQGAWGETSPLVKTRRQNKKDPRTSSQWLFLVAPPPQLVTERTLLLSAAYEAAMGAFEQCCKARWRVAE